MNRVHIVVKFRGGGGGRGAFFQVEEIAPITMTIEDPETEEETMSPPGEGRRGKESYVL